MDSEDKQLILIVLDRAFQHLLQGGTIFSDQLQVIQEGIAAGFEIGFQKDLVKAETGVGNNILKILPAVFF